MGGCTVSVCNQPTRSAQPCIPLGFAKSISSWKCWGKGRNVSSAGWQVTLCDTTWHVSSRRTLRTALHSLVYLLAAFYSKHKASVWCLSVRSSVSYCAYTQSESQGGVSIHTASVHFDLSVPFCSLPTLICLCIHDPVSVSLANTFLNSKFS